MSGPIRECANCYLLKPHKAHGLCATCLARRRYRPHPFYGPRSKPVWGPEPMKRLRDLFDTGKSLSKIAKEFGVTKNAIVGACWRNGLSRRVVFLDTEQRFAIMAAKLDAVMALPVQRLPATPRRLAAIEVIASQGAKVVRAPHTLEELPTA